MSMLRQARDRDTGRERDRLRQTGRGAQVNYYDDLGFSTTEAGYEEATEYKAGQAERIAAEEERLGQLQGEVNKAKGGLNRYQDQLGQYKSQISQAKSEIQKAREATDPSNMGKFADKYYEEAKKSALVKVNVVSGKDNKIEGSYWVPKDGAAELASGLQYKNRNPKTGEWYLHTQQDGRTMGQELHDMLRQSDKLTREQALIQGQREFAKLASNSSSEIAKAESQIGQAQEQYNSAYGNYIKQQGQVEIAEASVGLQKQQLAQYTEQEQQYLTELADKYDGKVDRMSKMMEKLNIQAEGGGEQAQPTVTEQIVQGENIPVAEAEAEVPAPEEKV